MEVLKIYNRKDPVKIIKSIREKSFDPECYGSMNNYLEWLQKSLWKFNQISLSIEGKTIEDKCQAMVDGLIKHGILELESRE